MIDNYCCVLLSSVWDSYDKLFKSPAINVSLFCRQKDEVLVNLRRQTGFSRKTFHFEKRWRWRESVQFIISVQRLSRTWRLGAQVPRGWSCRYQTQVARTSQKPALPATQPRAPPAKPSASLSTRHTEPRAQWKIIIINNKQQYWCIVVNKVMK